MLETEGKNIILREFTRENLHDPRYFEWLRDLAVVEPIYRLEYLLPLQFSELEKYVQSVLESKNDCFFAVYAKESGEFIGTQRIGHINWRSGIGDIGIMIGDRNYRGKGLSKDIVSTAARYCFNVLSLRKLTAGTPAGNTAMTRCFEGLGFKVEGTLRKQLLIAGDYQDHLLFGLLKEEFKPY